MELTHSSQIKLQSEVRPGTIGRELEFRPGEESVGAWCDRVDNLTFAALSLLPLPDRGLIDDYIAKYGTENAGVKKSGIDFGRLRLFTGELVPYPVMHLLLSANKLAKALGGALLNGDENRKQALIAQLGTVVGRIQAIEAMWSNHVCGVRSRRNQGNRNQGELSPEELGHVKEAFAKLVTKDPKNNKSQAGRRISAQLLAGVFPKIARSVELSPSHIVRICKKGSIAR